MNQRSGNRKDMGMARLKRMWVFLFPLLLVLMPACQSGYDYSRRHLTETVQTVCLKKHDFQAESVLSGTTLYVTGGLDGMVGKDMGVQQAILKKLFGVLQSVNLAALYTDAEVTFLVVRARDPRLGTSVTLMEYFPDYRKLMRLQMSGSDFQKRLVFLMNTSDQDKSEEWPALTMEDFMAHLAASSFRLKLLSNPFVQALLQVHQVRAVIQGQKLLLSMGQGSESGDESTLSQGIVRTSLVKTVADVIEAYDQKQGRIQQVVVHETGGKVLLRLTREDILEENRRQQSDAGKES